MRCPECWRPPSSWPWWTRCRRTRPTRSTLAKGATRAPRRGRATRTPSRLTACSRPTCGAPRRPSSGETPIRAGRTGAAPGCCRTSCWHPTRHRGSRAAACPIASLYDAWAWHNRPLFLSFFRRCTGECDVVNLRKYTTSPVNLCEFLY
uniref:Lox9 n=1 Tax=Arundo donax TaxID=35708 RepID=A0A0A9GDE4_ARUDO